MIAPKLLFHAIARHAEKRPDAPALIFGKQQITYRSFFRRIAGSATFLRQYGLQKGDRVFLWADNSPELAIAYFAVHSAGGVACPLPPDTPTERLAWLGERAEPKLFLGDSGGLPCPVLPLSFTSHDADQLPDVAIAPDDAADILFTSGTTGQPKGVVLTHRNIAAAARNIASFIGNDQNDREAVPLPLSHSFGLGRLRCMAHVGNAIVLAKGLADVPGLLRQMLGHRATGLALVPAGVEILRRTLGDNLRSLEGQLKYLELGSAAMQPNTREWLKQMLPHTRICHHYGLTEASRAVFLDLADDDAPPGSVGRASPGVTIDIVDETGTLLPPNQIGEIIVRGDVVSQSYFRDEAMTRARMTHYGLRTGDVGFLTEQGYLHLVGRRDDMINVGGKKVSPIEVEAVILKFSGIADVACVGTPDPDGLRGEVVVAYVVAEGPLDTEGLRKYASARLAPHAQPVRYVMVSTLPRTTSGKLQRYLLREHP